MQSFLSKVTAHILTINNDLSKLNFILPNKRAGLFLKTEIQKQHQHGTILPNILSIEDFIVDMSGLELAENTSLLFEFYSIYLKFTPKDVISEFDSFSKWATILLQDFNEIDSNLIDANHLLSYIYDSKRLENWNLKSNNFDSLSENYLKFFERIEILYSQLSLHLLNKNIGYQGLIYKKAFENIELFISSNKNEKYVFIGFNALNKAEEGIIHEILLSLKSLIYWDTDSFYFDQNNEAGKFHKQYKKNWTYYSSNSFNWIESNLNAPKNIEIYGTPKNISQIKKVGTILQSINKKEGNLDNTAVILCDENLLPVLLNSIPVEIHSANITMGYSLENIPLASLFESIFKLHINNNEFKSKFSIYYKDFLLILKHPLLYKKWKNNSNFNSKLKDLIQTNKTVNISQNDIDKLLLGEPYLSKVFTLTFDLKNKDVELLLKNMILLIDLLRDDESINFLDKEYLFRFHTIFQQLLTLNDQFGYIIDLKTLYYFYKQILKRESLSFKGEPLQGLQIMGMLESRVLDFENVILTSVNEGFIPVGNSQNSFIPFDIKIEKGLPTYREKDAIFAYHFYRLLQRTKNVYVIYNTETDDFGSGEQSRFITQLEIAKENKTLEKISITKKIVIPKLTSYTIPLKKIEKSDQIINILQKLAVKGFSPSSLTSYIRNPIDFYKRKIIRIQQIEEIEETVAATTFGTIIHESLYELYLPHVGTFINMGDITKMKKKVNNVVTRQFQNNYSNRAITTGKNYLALEMANQIILNFLNYELLELKNQKKIKIIGLEIDIDCQYKIKQLPFTLKLMGQIDRIDEVDGNLRIVDFKTGRVEKRELIIKDWNQISSDYSYSKSFQVLFYAFIYAKKMNINMETSSVESGIISFKNLQSGFMKVNNSTIKQEDIDQFLIQLDILILELFNLEIPFVEKQLSTKTY